ncbi:hypothetical protein [Duganella sp.]|uniref:hypothetical protein n=1 Tax=Duganella sp. TaxID=1904440 RepID=UPI0031E0B7B4
MPASYFAQIQSHPGWFTINVLVPLLLPFVVIAIVATAIGGWRAFIQMFKKSVNQGQLFWVVLSMLASMGYEAFSAYTRCAWLAETISWALGLCMSCAFVSSIFIAVNTVRTLNEPNVRAIAIYISLIMAVIVLYCYPVLHVLFAEC